MIRIGEIEKKRNSPSFLIGESFICIPINEHKELGGVGNNNEFYAAAFNPLHFINTTIDTSGFIQPTQDSTWISGNKIRFIDGEQIEKRDKLNNQWKQEIYKFPEIENRLRGWEAKRIENTIMSISAFNYLMVNLELTFENSILFKLTFKGNKTAYIKLHFSETDRLIEAFFGYYEGNHCNYNGIGTIDQVIDDLRQLLRA